jgi:hypothetical protein
VNISGANWRNGPFFYSPTKGEDVLQELGGYKHFTAAVSRAPPSHGGRLSGQKRPLMAPLAGGWSMDTTPATSGPIIRQPQPQPARCWERRAAAARGVTSGV